MVTVCESEAEFKELEAKHSTIGVFLTDAEIKIAKDCHLFDDIRLFIRMAENEGMIFYYSCTESIVHKEHGKWLIFIIKNATDRYYRDKLSTILESIIDGDKTDFECIDNIPSSTSIAVGNVDGEMSTCPLFK